MPAYLSAFGSKADVSQPLPDIAIYDYASPPLGSGPELSKCEDATHPPRQKNSAATFDPTFVPRRRVLNSQCPLSGRSRHPLSVATVPI